MKKVVCCLWAFVEQQVDDGEIGQEPELVLENLVVRCGQAIAVVWLACFFRMYFQAKVIFSVRGECLSEPDISAGLQDFQEGECELRVEVEQEIEFLLEKGFQGILVIEVERGVVVGGFDGAPVCALPRGDILDAHLLDDSHPVVMDRGDDEVQHSVAVHDDGPVAIRLFLIPLFSVNECFARKQEGEILHRREVGGGKQELFHR